MVSGTISPHSRGAFHLSLTGTGSLSVTREYLALYEMVLADSDRFSLFRRTQDSVGEDRFLILDPICIWVWLPGHFDYL